MKPMYLGLIFVISLISFSHVAGCTHQKVSVHKTTDVGLTCDQILSEIAQVESVKKDIEDKTGFSGRNVGMGILFWPGIIVNEVQGSSAEEVANKRLEQLHGMYRDKGCR